VALGEHVRRKDISAAEAVEAAIVVIERLNPQLNAVIHRLYDMARAQVPNVPPEAPFAGVPFLLKELASMWRGAPLTNSCAWLKDARAPQDSEATRRTKAAGFVLVGESNAPENGWAITSEPKLYGATHNPWRADVTPGGSSGGAASAVAAGMVPLAEASDGAGSIRVPASCCGVIGLKPSRGRITIAPFGLLVRRGVLLLCDAHRPRHGGISRRDDRRIAWRPVHTTHAFRALGGARDARAQATAHRLHHNPARRRPYRSPEAVVAVRKAASLLERLGHCVEEKNMALDAASAWKTYTAMTPAESAAGFDFLTPLAGRPVTQADVEPVTWAIIQRGRAQTAVEHVNLMNALRGLSRDIAADLMSYDVYLTPVLTQKPRPLGYWDMSEPDLDRYNARWTDAVFMFPFNIAPLPAIALPLHWSADGLPIGVQAVGHYGDEATLLALAAVLEAETKWADRHPSVSAWASRPSVESERR
jgi:amidase